MKVTKSTWVDVDQGRVQDVLHSLRNSKVPDHAVAVELSTDHNRVDSDGIMVHFYTKVYIKFEWTDEE